MVKEPVRSCLICGDDSPKRFLAKVNLIFATEYDLVECSHCGVICFNPLPTEPELETFYSGSYYDFEKSREEGKGMAFARRLLRWKPSGRFLDVGCATGFFINGIRRHSHWEVYGTEFGESAVRFAREKLGLNVVRGNLKDAAFPDAFFDYVHVNNVLEHVLDPVSLLRECRRILKPDGVFFLSVPNGFNDTLDLIEFWKEENKPARSKNGHIFFFPARTLMMLFEQIGFDIEKKKTYSLKRGLRSIGVLPRKSDWKKDYFPRVSPESAANFEIAIPEEKKRHSDFYYRFRFVQGNLQMIPGLCKFGLDFLFILKLR
jgi:SAM-dependent methyltransferase